MFPANGSLARRLPSLLRVPVSPVPRIPRYYEGATTSHPRIVVAYWFASTAHAIPRFRARLSAPASPKGGLQARIFCLYRPSFLRSSRVDASGISQVFRRSIPCLCCVPGPRSNRRALAMTVASMLPSPSGQRRLRQWLISGLTHSFGTCCHTLHASRRRSRARLASDWSANLCREGVEPSGPLRKVSARLTTILLSCSPDATGFRLRSSRATLAGFYRGGLDFSLSKAHRLSILIGWLK